MIEKTKLLRRHYTRFLSTMIRDDDRILEGPPSITEIDSLPVFIRSLAKDVRKQIEKEAEEELFLFSLSMRPIQTLLTCNLPDFGFNAWMRGKSFGKNDVDLSWFWTQQFLTVCNLQAAIYHLTLSGLDGPAKIITRSFSETCFQIIMFAGCPEKLDEFLSSDPANSTGTWFKLFKKGRMERAVREILEENGHALGPLYEAFIADVFQDQSLFVHNGLAGIFHSAFSESLTEPDQWVYNFYGAASAQSRNTLLHASLAVFFLCIIFTREIEKNYSEYLSQNQQWAVAHCESHAFANTFIEYFTSVRSSGSTQVLDD